ncbi:MAG: hypothetical protein ABI946_00950 [Chthoniobacterales bacterium]
MNPDHRAGLEEDIGRQIDILMKKPRLIVIVPGLEAKIQKWDRLIARLKQESELAEETCVWLIYDPKAKGLGRQRAKDMVRNLVAHIDEEWVRNNGFEKILLVGHSLGGLVVRGAYVTGRGANPDQPQAHDWAPKVSRIVLLAAPNRGVEKLPFGLARVSDWLLRQMPSLAFTYQDLMRGSNFVTSLRINWIRLFAAKNGETATLPDVVQLLGVHDTIVHRDDSVDVLSFSTAIAGEIPDADHKSLPDLDSASDPDGRYLMLKTAILDPKNLPVHGQQANVPTKPTFSHVVFVLHGIRASNIANWLREVAKEVMRVYPPDTDVRRPPYGYFTALSFVLPRVRRRNIRIFQDAYTEALAASPNAIFDFIGHSNGTYMLGESLRDVSGMSFRNVVVAGAVLPSDYPWAGKLGVQVDRVRSERGQKDWPVGWLCSALNGGLGMTDVGTGGYTGFVRGQVEEEQYSPGGHGGMFNEENIPRMVRWINNQDPGPELPSQVPELAWWSVVSRMCPHLLHGALVLFFLGVGYLVWAHSFLGLLIVAGVLYIVYFILSVL